MTHVYMLAVVLLFLTASSPMTAKESKMTDTPRRNRLANAISPYLQAHADNPVDWYEWGEEAFAQARHENKPIFLSIGYNACHWCHVMEHESFENPNIAALLNEHFVSIKVDREERPDIDQIYMSAVQAMTGSGGWPMSVFLTPDKKPFFAGTYFPPDDSHGRPGFRKILTELAGAYRAQQADIVKSADAITEHIAQNADFAMSPRPIDRAVLMSGANTVYGQIDHRYGGFGGAPKFPHAANLSLLFRAGIVSGESKYATGAYLTLQRMAQGGLYDQLGGGFHRYSVDERWLVPHFEKMLYDNALLVIPYLEAWQLSGNRDFLDIVDGTLSYLQTSMTDTAGGFYSTQDADSEGEEGRYYLWTKAEVEDLLGAEASWFCEYFDITENGNFEHEKSILNRGRHSDVVRARLNLRADEFKSRLAESRHTLLTARKNRIAPVTDDKILASWNGLAISAFAQAAQVTGNESYLASARRAADFVLNAMSEEKNLYHSFRRGHLLKVELLEDYAYFIAGLIDLYQASHDEKYLTKAMSLAGTTVSRFADDSLTFYASAEGDTGLIYRPRDITDGATPSPASVMVYNLLRLGVITNDSVGVAQGEKALAAMSGLASRVPKAAATLLMAGHFDYTGAVEIIISGDDPDKMRQFNKNIFSRYLPNKIVVGNINGGVSQLPLLQGRQNLDELTYFFCKDKTCRLPVTDAAALQTELDWATAN